MLTSSRTSSFSFLLERFQHDSFIKAEDRFPSSSPDGLNIRKIAIFGSAGFLKCNSNIEGSEALYIKNVFYPCGMEKTDEIIKKCKPSFIKHHNENQYQPVFLMKSPSISAVKQFLCSLSKKYKNCQIPDLGA